MTQADLDALPEIRDVVLWADKQDPFFVTDAYGQSWFLGIYHGTKYKRKAHE